MTKQFADRSAAHAVLAAVIQGLLNGWPIVVGLAIGQLLSSPAQAAGSLELECPRLTVEVAPFTYTVDEGLSARQLAAKLKAGSPQYKPGDMGLGAVLTMQASAVTVSRDSQTGCRSIDVKAGFLPATLFIASELARNSICGKRHVLTHELKHVGFYTDFVKELARTLPAELTAASESLSTKSDSQMQGELLKLLVSRTNQVIAVHNGLDSEQEYAMNSVVCGGEIPRMTREE